VKGRGEEQGDGDSGWSQRWQRSCGEEGKVAQAAL